MRSGHRRRFPDEGGAARALCEARHPVHIRARARHLAGAPQTIKVQRTALEHVPEGREGTPLVAEMVREPTGIGAQGLRMRPPQSSPFLLIKWPKRGAWHHGKMLTRTVGNYAQFFHLLLTLSTQLVSIGRGGLPPKKLLPRLSWRTQLGFRVGKREPSEVCAGTLSF